MNEHIQPEGVFDSRPFGFTQVVATGPGRLVFVSGQVGVEPSGKPLGGDDVGAQAELALSNLRASLAAAGAAASDVVMMRIYLVDLDREKVAAVSPHIAAFFDGGEPAAQTMIGVQALVLPALRIEIEAYAVVPE